MKLLLAALTLLISSSGFADEKVFVKVDGKIAGKPVAFECQGAEVSNNFFPQSSPKVSASVNCQKGGNTVGLTFSYPWAEDPTKVKIPAYDGSKVISELPKYFTLKVALPSKEMVEVHSFKNNGDKTRQHFKGSPVVKIAAFKKIKKSGATYFGYKGSVTAEFEEKSIDSSKVGSAGNVAISFYFDVKCSTPPGAKHSCSDGGK